MKLKEVTEFIDNMLWSPILFLSSKVIVCSNDLCKLMCQIVLTSVTENSQNDVSQGKVWELKSSDHEGTLTLSHEIILQAPKSAMCSSGIRCTNYSPRGLPSRAVHQDRRAN